MFSHFNFTDNTSVNFVNYFNKLQEARTLQEKGSFYDAMFILNNLIATHEYLPGAYKLRAEILLTGTSTAGITQQEALELACADFYKALAIDLRDGKLILAHANLAKKLKDNLDFKKELELAQTEITDLKEFHQWYYMEIITYLKPYFDKHDHRILKAEIQKLLDTDPMEYNGELTKESSYHTRLGMIAMQEANSLLARYHFIFALQYFKYDFIAASFNAHLQYIEDPKVKIYSVLTDVIKFFDYPGAYIVRAQLNHDNDKKKEAESDVINFLRMANQDHFIRFQCKKNLILSYILADFKVINANPEIFSNFNVIDVNPEKVNENYRKLSLSVVTGDYDNVLKASEESLKVYPHNSELYFGRYTAFFGQGKYDQALTSISLAILTAEIDHSTRRKYFLTRAILLATMKLPVLSEYDFLHAKNLSSEPDEFITSYLLMVKNKMIELMAKAKENSHLIIRYIDIFVKYATAKDLFFNVSPQGYLSIEEFRKTLLDYQKSKFLKNTDATKERIIKTKNRIDENCKEMKMLKLDTTHQITNLLNLPDQHIKPASITFKNNAIARKHSSQTPFKANVEEKGTRTFADLQKEYREAKLQALKEKEQKELQRKMDEKEEAKRKRQALLKKRTTATKHKTTKEEEFNYSIPANLSEINFLSEQQSKVEIEIVKTIPLLNIERKVFSAFKNFKPKDKIKKGVKLRGGSCVDRIRRKMQIDDLKLIDSDIDFITELPAIYMPELFPEGHFNPKVDGCYELNIEQGDKVIKIDIYCLPDLNPKTILENSDYFAITVDDAGIVEYLTPWVLESIQKGELRLNDAKKPMHPAVLFRTPYQQSKRNLKPTSDVLENLQQNKHKLADRSLISTDLINYWINHLSCYGMAEKNYKLLRKYKIYDVLFPSYIREIVNDDAWLCIQMFETAKIKYTSIQYIYASFVIAIAMQGIEEDIALGYKHKFTLSNILGAANEIIRTNNLFAAAYLPECRPTQSIHSLPPPIRKYLLPAINSWLEVHKAEELMLIDLPTMDEKINFYLQPAKLPENDSSHLTYSMRNR